MASIGPIEVKVNFVDTRKPAGPFKVRREAGSFVLTYPDGSEVIAPIIWNYVEAWVNSAYNLGRKDERRGRENAAHKFKKGDRVKGKVTGSEFVVSGVVDGWLLGEGYCQYQAVNPDNFTLVPPKPATVTRKPLFVGVPPFIGGPLDGQQLGYGDTCVETLNISEEGKPLSVMDKGHTYRLGTVNGEKMMVYSRENK